MTHPLVVTLDKKSAPRTIFAGDKLVEVSMPAGTRVIYPRPPLEPLKDVDAAIRYALSHPYGPDPLHAAISLGETPSGGSTSTSTTQAATRRPWRSTRTRLPIPIRSASRPGTR